MLISEFIDRTGFRPTAECYEQHIEPKYNASDLKKDEWCKEWKRKGGIAEAYRWQVNYDTIKINEAKERSVHNAQMYFQLQQRNDQLIMENKQLSDDKEDYRITLEDCRKQLEEANEAMSEEADEKMELIVFLIQQAEKWSATDLREKAIEIIGEKDYISYKIYHDMNLWEEDKQLILKLIC